MITLDAIKKIYHDWRGSVFHYPSGDVIVPHEQETRPTPSQEELEAAWIIVKEEQDKAASNAAVLAKLAEIDLKSIRALRDGDATWIAKYKADADAERLKLKQ